MPKKMGSLERTKYEIGRQMGFAHISNVSIEFKGEDHQILRINITDGAGNGTSFISLFHMMLNAEVDSKSQTGYERTETFDNTIVLMKYLNPKYGDNSKFNYLVEDRLYVEATGWQMEPQELWDYLKNLKVEELLSN